MEVKYFECDSNLSKYVNNLSFYNGEVVAKMVCAEKTLTITCILKVDYYRKEFLLDKQGNYVKDYSDYKVISTITDKKGNEYLYETTVQYNPSFPFMNCIENLKKEMVGSCIMAITHYNPRRKISEVKYENGNVKFFVEHGKRWVKLTDKNEEE